MLCLGRAFLWESKTLLDLYTISQRLQIHEGLRLKPYFCTRGKQTIGVGRCLDTNPLTPEEEKVVGDWRHGITKGAAIYLLHNDIKRITKECKKKIAFFKELDDERQYALLDMAFNLGINGLLQFRRMLEALACGNYNTAAAECLSSKYAQDTGVRAERIARVIKTGKFTL